MIDFEEKIYEAAFLPETWPQVLDQLADSVQAEGALIANVSSPSNIAIMSPRIDQLYADYFAEGWGYDNSRTHALLATQHQQCFVSDAAQLSNNWMERQPVYRDFLRPRGFGYAAGTVIAAPSGDRIAISIDKKIKNGPVPQSDLDRLDALRPHLARSALLASRFEFTRIEASLQALQIATLPAAMLRDDGTVIECNALFLDFSDQIRIETQNRLRFLHRSTDTAFSEIFSSQEARRDIARNGRSFPIPPSGTAPPAIVHLAPIRGVVRDIFWRTTFFMIVTPVDRRHVPDIDTVQGLFDLSPTEAKVGRSLASGHTVQATALQFGVGVETVRSHVKSILLKSGMERQIDFIAAISTLRDIDKN